MLQSSSCCEGSGIIFNVASRWRLEPMTAVEKRFYTSDDLWDIQSQPENQDKNFELIDGELCEVTPNSLVSNLVATELIYYLKSHVRAHDLGFVAGTDAGFTISPGNTLEPDVAFIAKSRLPKMPERYFEG